MRRWVLFILLAIFTGAASAAEPTTEPYTGPTTQPADFPQTLVHQIVAELRKATDISIDVEQQERRSLIGLPKKASHENSLEMMHDASQTIRIRRPNRFRFTMEVPAGDDGRRLAPTVVFTGDRLTLCFERSSPTEWKRGYSGPMRNASADMVVQSSEAFVKTLAPELARLLDPKADVNFLAATSNWKWLGESTDNASKAWRVAFEFKTGIDERQLWEMTVSQKPPHRIVRIVMTAEEGFGIQELKPGVDPRDADSGDVSKMEWTNYRQNVRTEVRFTRWALDVPIPDDTFALPQGTFKETVFRNSDIKLPLGATVRLAELAHLKATNGEPVDVSKPTGPIVLDFWFAHCGPCMYWTPKVEELVREYRDRGVTLYGVNDIDSAEDAAAKMKSEQWAGVTSLVDKDGAWRSVFDISAYPTVIVIAPDGKILYRGYPGEDGGMRRLKDALDSVTASAPH